MSFLDQIYSTYHKREYLGLDPLGILDQYRGKPHLTELCVLSGLMAFGRVERVRVATESLIDRVGLNSEEFFDELLQGSPEKNFFPKIKGFVHRIYRDHDIWLLLECFRYSHLEHGSIKAHFEFYFKGEDTVGPALSAVIADYLGVVKKSRRKSTPMTAHLFNSPALGGACKRWLMILKWLVRPDDGIDLGLWNAVNEVNKINEINKMNSRITPAHLVMPLDVHVTRFAVSQGWIKSMSVNWKQAVRVTESLRRFDPLDPTKYDFAICRAGMLKVRGQG